MAVKLAHLLARKPMIAGALARRYPLIICDEHQDATAAQDQIILVLHKAGVPLHVFGDAMQRIFGGRKCCCHRRPEIKRWMDLKEQADAFEELDTPHRWANTNPALGHGL